MKTFTIDEKVNLRRLLARHYFFHATEFFKGGPARILSALFEMYGPNHFRLWTSRFDGVEDFGRRALSRVEVLASTKDPLSNQLKRLTGDGWNAIDWTDTLRDGVIVHKKTGLRVFVRFGEN